MAHFNIKNIKGFTIVEGVVAGGILSIIVVGAMSAFQSTSNAKLRNDLLTSIIKYRYNIISSLRSPEVLSAAGATNNIPCLANHSKCDVAATPYAPLTVQNALGEKLTDKADPTLGFRADMLSCTSFPSSECPFRFETDWRSLCNAANGSFCDSPQLKVKGTLKVFSDLKTAINTNVYGFEITLGQILGTYEQSCTSIGGSYVPGNPPRCDLPMAGNCPNPTDVVVGYDRTAKTKICRPFFQSYFNNVPVPAGFVAVGVTSAGYPIIKQIIIPPAPFVSQLIPPNPLPASVITDGGVPPIGTSTTGWGGLPAVTDGGIPLTDGSFSGDGGCGGGGC